MKAVSLQDIHKLAVIEAEQPAINGPNEVIIKVQKVGVCGSEIHAFEGTHPYRKPPSILGHEMVGTVVEIGSGVTRFAAGDRVTVDPQWPCGTCEWCQRGDHNLCPDKMVLGTPNWPGAMGEYFVIPEQSVFAVPDHLSDDQAAMIEPLGVAVHAARRAQLKAGQSVLILGGGSIGQVTTAMARVRGANPIIVGDIKPHCLDTACQMGATHTVLVGQEDIVEKVMAITGGKGVDVVFLTVGVGELFEPAFDVVRRQGTIVPVALYKKPVLIHPYRIINKDISVVGTIMSNDADIEEAIDLIASGEINPDPIVTHQLAIDDAQRGFELAASKADGAIKVMLNFD